MYILDIYITDVKDWDGIKYNDHSVSKVVRDIINEELTDPKYSVNVKDLYQNKL